MSKAEQDKFERNLRILGAVIQVLGAAFVAVMGIVEASHKPSRRKRIKKAVTPKLPPKQKRARRRKTNNRRRLT